LFADDGDAHPDGGQERSLAARDDPLVTSEPELDAVILEAGGGIGLVALVVAFAAWARKQIVRWGS
jgi:hypothetical protein